MFGYVRPNLDDLTEAQKARYNRVYCGLCRTLGSRHGLLGKMSLTYDMTFLVLFLASLYEPGEQDTQAKCMAHPRKAHDETIIQGVDEYAADMTVALMYHKFLDDWHDDHKLLKKGAADILEKDYAAVKAAWPDQCAAIETCLRELDEIEKAPEPQPDAAANSFGRLMGEIFLWRRDFWQGTLRQMGESLGRFVYMMDAAIDYDKDVRRGGYNPLTALGIAPQEMKPILMQLLGGASVALEELPLVQDAELMRNILYSGVWQLYNIKMQKEGEKHGE